MLLAKVLIGMLAGRAKSSCWTISQYGRVVGTLMDERGQRRLSWFNDADPRLRNYAGPLSDDPSELGRRLSLRIGVPISLDVLG